MATISSKNVTIGKNTKNSGSVTVTNNVTLSSNGSNTGTITATNTVTANDTSSLSGTVTAGTVVLNNNSTTSSATISATDVTANNSSTIASSTTITAENVTINSGSTVNNSTVTATTITANSSSSITNNAIINGSLTVNDTAALTNNAVVNGAVTLNNYSSATDTTITGNLAVSDSATVTTATITGDVLASSGASLTDSTITGNLTVTGSAGSTNNTVTGNLTASGGTVTGTAVSGDASVSGGAVDSTSSIGGALTLSSGSNSAPVTGSATISGGTNSGDVAGDIVVTGGSNSGDTAAGNIYVYGTATNSGALAAGNTAGTVYTGLDAAAPVITTQPTNATVDSGDNATFTITATGATSYQWRVKAPADTVFSDINGATNATLTLSGVTNAEYNGNFYICTVTNSYGSVYSGIRLLTVNAASYSSWVVADDANNHVLYTAQGVSVTTGPVYTDQGRTSPYTGIFTYSGTSYYAVSGTPNTYRAWVGENLTGSVTLYTAPTNDLLAAHVYTNSSLGTSYSGYYRYNGDTYYTFNYGVALAYTAISSDTYIASGGKLTTDLVYTNTALTILKTGVFLEYYSGNYRYVLSGYLQSYIPWTVSDDTNNHVLYTADEVELLDGPVRTSSSLSSSYSGVFTYLGTSYYSSNGTPNTFRAWTVDNAANGGELYTVVDADGPDVSNVFTDTTLYTLYTGVFTYNSTDYYAVDGVPADYRAWTVSGDSNNHELYTAPRGDVTSSTVYADTARTNQYTGYFTYNSTDYTVSSGSVSATYHGFFITYGGNNYYYDNTTLNDGDKVFISNTSNTVAGEALFYIGTEGVNGYKRVNTDASGIATVTLVNHSHSTTDNVSSYWYDNATLSDGDIVYTGQYTDVRATSIVFYIGTEGVNGYKRVNTDASGIATVTLVNHSYSTTYNSVTYWYDNATLSDGDIVYTGQYTDVRATNATIAPGTTTDNNGAVTVSTYVEWAVTEASQNTLYTAFGVNITDGPVYTSSGLAETYEGVFTYSGGRYTCAAGAIQAFNSWTVDLTDTGGWLNAQTLYTPKGDFIGVGGVAVYINTNSQKFTSSAYAYADKVYSTDGLGITHSNYASVTYTAYTGINVNNFPGYMLFGASVSGNITMYTNTGLTDPVSYADILFKQKIRRSVGSNTGVYTVLTGINAITAINSGNYSDFGTGTDNPTVVTGVVQYTSGKYYDFGSGTISPVIADGPINARLYRDGADLGPYFTATGTETCDNSVSLTVYYSGLNLGDYIWVSTYNTNTANFWLGDQTPQTVAFGGYKYTAPLELGKITDIYTCDGNYTD